MNVKVPSVAGAAVSPSVEGGKDKFGKVLDSMKGGQQHVQAAVENAPRRIVSDSPRIDQASATRAHHLAEAQAPRGGCIDMAHNARAQQAASALDRVSAAQQRLDRVLQLAQSGKSFTAAELLALQAQVYRATQEIDLAGKVVEKATSGVKQVLQTQV